MLFEIKIFIKLKWSHFGGPESNMTGVFLRKGKLGDRLTYWECHVNVNSPTYKSRRKVWNKCFLHSSQKEPTLLKTWSSTSSLQNSEKICFCSLSHPVWYTIFWQPWQTKTEWTTGAMILRWGTEGYFLLNETAQYICSWFMLQDKT